QAATAIQNARLYEESQRKASQLQTAAEIARDTSSTLALEALLQRTVHLLCERFNYSHASVFLMDETGQYAVVAESTGLAGEELKRRSHKLVVGSQSVIGYVTGSGSPLVVNDVTLSSVHLPNPLLPDTRAELGIPMKIGERVIGALDVQAARVNAFTPDDISVLQTLADQIAVAVDNARSYELSQKAVAEMREVDRLKSQFLANMSHELRTPLNSIIGFSRVILKGIDGPISEPQEQDLSAIYSSGQHLLGLINDVLDLSKIEAGKMELAFEENVNLTDLINSVMSTAVGLVKDKPIQLKRELPAELPCVRADPMKLRQVLLNLIANAAKFTDEGWISVAASVQAGPDGGQEVVIRVTDTGPGISPEDQEKLFQPFSQVDASLTRKTGGSGLGLSISRRLVEMHGGRISISSQLGQGSSFFFILPLAARKLAPAPRLAARRSDLVLAIDSDPRLVYLYERYIKNHGYQMLALNDLTKAVELASEVQPFAITLDVAMQAPAWQDGGARDGGAMDGWQALKDLKANPATRHIPVIICSLLDGSEQALRFGAAAYLKKPILEEDLAQAIENLADGGRPRPEPGS
ncbi:MAG TPA: ATP-binding protein, partial [Anaerolineales bacterium]